MDIPEEPCLLVFNPNQFKVFTILVDLILPRTDTPGAIDVDVHFTIDQLLHSRFNDLDKAQLLQGIDNIELLSQMNFDKPFINTTETEKQFTLDFLSKDATSSANPNNHLFFVLRGLVITTYFQSPRIAKKVLKYDPIPGEYNGCIPLDDINGQWALV